ncbi:hypothetical protein HPY1089_05705 [Helicobacter pylori]|nr:hypothetical protein HPY1089_05705 [Helicobacter pylori]KHL78684.1 hypothetical protein HPY1152_03885 [Helicobacter pylori]
MLRKYHPQRRGIDEHLGDDTDLLILFINRIKKGEIKLRKVSQMFSGYKRVISDILENENSLEYINNFIGALSKETRDRQFSAYERLFVKLLNLTPIRSSEIITIKCSDFYIKGDYCLVANKYLLFIPLFMEAKSIPKDDTLLIDNIIKYQFTSTRIPKVQNACQTNRRILRDIGYLGVQQSEFAIRLLHYLISLGLSELGEAITWIKVQPKTKKLLGLKL